MEDPQNIKLEILYDSVIPLLGIYTKEIKTLTQKDTCTFISMAALFIIVKRWKTPKVPFHGGMDKEVVVYILRSVRCDYSAIKVGKSYHLQQHG